MGIDSLRGGRQVVYAPVGGGGRSDDDARPDSRPSPPEPPLPAAPARSAEREGERPARSVVDVLADPGIAHADGRDVRVRRMLALAGLDEGTGWPTEQWRWTLRLVYEPAGIQNAGLVDHTGARIVCDLGGNHPHWIYLAEHGPTKAVAPLGPDDARAVFDARHAELDQLRREKEQALRAVRTELERLKRLSTLLGVTPDWRWPSGERLGDRDLAALTEIASRLEARWAPRMPDFSMAEGLAVVTDLERVAEALGSRSSLAVMSAEELGRLNEVLGGLKHGTSLGEADRTFLLELYDSLLLRQTARVRDRRAWALGHPVVAWTPDQGVNPSWHANLQIATWLVELMKKHPDWRPLIADEGANVSVLFRMLDQVGKSEGEAMASLSGGVVDIERDPTLYQAGANPHRVRADIASVSDVLDATDDVARDLVRDPHQFQVVVNSFVLGLLDPEQLTNAIVGFDHLLAEPPDPTEASLEKSPLIAFPMLTLATPEHAPLAGTGFDRALREHGGFSLVGHVTRYGALREDTMERLRREQGKEVAATLRSLLDKPVHLSIYAKTAPADREALQALRIPGVRQAQSHGPGLSPALEPTALNPSHLLALDAVTKLGAGDYTVDALSVVTRAELDADLRYDAFGERLAALLWGSRFLSGRERGVVEDVITQCRANPPFLLRTDVDFVLETSEAIRPSYDRARKEFPHLGTDLENCFRRECATTRNRIEAEMTASGTWSQAAFASRMDQAERDLRRAFLALHELADIEGEYRRRKHMGGLGEEFFDDAVLRFVRGEPEVRIDRADRTMTIGSNCFSLAKKELKLAEFMLLHQGVILSPKELGRGVWDDENTPENTIRAGVRALRLKAGRHAWLFATVHGYGYRFGPPDWIPTPEELARRGEEPIVSADGEIALYVPSRLVRLGLQSAEPLDVMLSPSELPIFRLCLDYPGAVMTPDDLSRLVEESAGTFSGRDAVHAGNIPYRVWRLKQKLGPFGDDLIRSAGRRNYRFGTAEGGAPAVPSRKILTSASGDFGLEAEDQTLVVGLSGDAPRRIPLSPLETELCRLVIQVPEDVIRSTAQVKDRLKVPGSVADEDIFEAVGHLRARLGFDVPVADTPVRTLLDWVLDKRRTDPGPSPDSLVEVLPPEDAAELLSLPIAHFVSAMNMRKRTADVLTSHWYVSVPCLGYLIQESLDLILSIPTCGVTSAGEILDALALLGLRLGMKVGEGWSPANPRQGLEHGLEVSPRRIAWSEPLDTELSSLDLPPAAGRLLREEGIIRYEDAVRSSAVTVGVLAKNPGAFKQIYRAIAANQFHFNMDVDPRANEA